MFQQEITLLSASVRAAFDRLGVPAPESLEWVPTPFRGNWAIGTAACFQAAAAEARLGRAQNVPARATELAESVVPLVDLPAAFQRIKAANGYLNASFDTSTFASKVVDEAIGLGTAYGRGAPQSERVMVEYAQPNTHHSFHIGHLRNAVLGESLARLFEFSGYPVIRASYPGDIGLGVITCVWAYLRFHNGLEPEGIHERGRWLAKIYHEAHALLTAQENETPEQAALRQKYEAEVRETYRRWDSGDPEIREVWQRTRQWSLDELADILEMLDIHMDVFFFESEADAPAKEIVEDMVRRGLAEDERAAGGPVLVRIDEKLGLAQEKYRTAVLLRQDGTTLYLAKDLALARLKFEKYGVDRSVYVVDSRQSLHLQQAFKILELYGFPQAARCHHLAYGFVSLPEGAMSSRRGNVVFFRDVLEEADQRVLTIIAEKNPDLPEALRTDVARTVGLGALNYAMLSVDNRKDIVFEWERALNFDGQTAPYIQNAHVRANSILRKAGELPRQAQFDYSLTPEEIELVDRVSRLPEVVRQAAEDYKPLILANYAYDLAKSFHGFYHEVPVLTTAEPEIRAARLRLIAACRQTLANALWLLAVRAPEVM
ncbi:MAG: arginine--tRNA ligase [Anaerolineales bacterium]